MLIINLHTNKKPNPTTNTSPPRNLHLASRISHPPDGTFACMERLALFCSGNGTNAQAIIDYLNGNAKVAVGAVLANNPSAFALERGQAAGLPTLSFTKDEFYNTSNVDDFLAANGITGIVLAGFLWLVPARLLAKYPKRVLNIHPALLPAFGGTGMYGHRVHDAVSKAGVAETGITIHLADEEYDRGPILVEARVPIVPGATPAEIEQAVRKLELEHYPKAIEAYFQAL